MSNPQGANTPAESTEDAQPRYCRERLITEQVVTTTYRLVCPVHGTYAVGLSAKEAAEATTCAMPHKGDAGA